MTDTPALEPGEIIEITGDTIEEVLEQLKGMGLTPEQLEMARDAMIRDYQSRVGE